MRTVLVTGGAGFIGHHLVKELLLRNCRTIVIDNLSNSNKIFESKLKDKQDDAGHFRFYKADIRDEEAITSIFEHEEIDTCIHLAAKISISDSIRYPRETLDVNVLGTLNTLLACRENRVHNFIFASSAAVYGNTNVLPISEDRTLCPVSLYGASKLAGEALVSSFRYDIRNCKALRFFNVYGEGQSSAYSGVIKKFAERLSNHMPPIIHGTGNQTRDFIHVSDAVRAIIFSVEKDLNTHKYSDESIAINIGTGRPVTISDLAHLMVQAYRLDEEIDPVYSDPIPGDVMNSHADTTKAQKILGFSAKDFLRQGNLNWQDF